MKSSSLYQSFFSAGLFFLYLCCFFLPISSSAMTISSAGMVLCWLLSGEYKKLPQLIKTNRILWPPLLLFAMLFIGVFYSSAGWQESLMILKKYRELFYFVIVFSFLQTARNNSTGFLSVINARYVLLAGMTTLMLISYAMYFGWVPIEKAGFSTIHHITHSFFMAMLSFWIMQEFADGIEQKRGPLNFLLLPIFILATVNIFFISLGRSGMVIYIILLILSAIQRLKPRQTVISLLLVCGLLAGIYYNSENAATRINAAVRDIQTYNPGASRSSLGMRFDWWQNSVTLIKKAPLTGYGTGSFATEQKKLTKGTATQISDNPHNEYLMLGVQLGIPGIIAFFALLTSLFSFSFSLPAGSRNMLQGTVLAFAWGCLANSWLLDSHPSHFFLIVTAVLVSEKRQKVRS